jgi:hypothetical protein
VPLRNNIKVQRKIAIPADRVALPATVRGVERHGERFELYTLLDNLSATGLYPRLARPVKPGAPSLKNGDTVTCVFENTGQGVTRTQGFWATHSQLAYIAWFGGTAFGHTFPGVAGVAGIGDQLLCGTPLPAKKNIDTLGKLMGGFWSDVSKKSTGAKRSALDQARMQLLQQLLAAELNASAFGSVPSGGSGQFAVWESAYYGTNQTAIQNALQGAASFNNSGDSSTFTPGTSADSKNARSVANYVFWDVLP